VSWSHLAAMIRTLIFLFLLIPPFYLPPWLLDSYVWLVNPLWWLVSCNRPLRLWLYMTHSEDRCISIWLIPRTVLLGYVLLGDSYVESDLYITQADVALVLQLVLRFSLAISSYTELWNLFCDPLSPLSLLAVKASSKHRVTESLNNLNPQNHLGTRRALLVPART
jgi:hypothetical protein